MPNRILRDWTDSAAIDKLTYQEEVLFTRLIMKADDFGNFYRDAVLIRSLVFPRKDGLRSADIDRWLTNLEAADLIRTYPAKGDSFLHIVNFGQRLRQKRRMFPEPPESIMAATWQQHDDNSPLETKRSRKEVETETEVEAAQAPDPRFEKKLILQNPFGDQFLEHWILWKNYKKTEFKFLFKSIESEQAAINDLVQKSGGDEETAKNIIHQSMANGWKGLFKLKNDESASGKAQSKPSAKATNTGLHQVFAKRYSEGAA